MEIKTRLKDKVVILDLDGCIDENSANLIEIIGQCLHDSYSDILCNFEEVEFINYMGISVMVIAYKEVMNNKGRMKFVNIPIHLRGLFSISGLDRVIDIYAREDLAINSFKEDKAIEEIKKLKLRRRFKRLPMEIKIELKTTHDKGAFCLKAEMFNLSAIGAYIYGCDKFNLGDELVIKLKLGTKPQDLELPAKVVWLSDKQVQHHMHPGMGIEFSDISSEAQQKLIEFIDRNMPRSNLEKTTYAE